MNEEFLDQLALYEAMNCELDTSSVLYKQFRLNKVTEKYPGTSDFTPDDVFVPFSASVMSFHLLHRDKCKSLFTRVPNWKN